MLRHISCCRLVDIDYIGRRFVIIFDYVIVRFPIEISNVEITKLVNKINIYFLPVVTTSKKEFENFVDVF